MRRALVPLIMMAAGLAGCSEPDATPPDVLKLASPGTVTDCGTFTLDQGETLPQDAGLCLLTASREGRIARLSVTAPTVEGDPIVTVYATRPDGGVEVVEDTRADAYGAQEITREVCTGPSAGDHGFHFTNCGP
ncbi:DUF4362 domain-containing protein [Actinoplanes sp. CA-131856]